MKKVFCLVLAMLLLAGCSIRVMDPGTTAAGVQTPQPIGPLELETLKHINVVAASGEIFMALKADGTIYYTVTPNLLSDTQQLEVVCKALDGWKDLCSIAAGYTHLVGLKTDGTVVAAGKNDRGQCDVQDWTDIVCVTAGMYYTVGVKADGTLVYAGDPSAIGQIEWESTGVVAVSGSDYMLMALLEDGSVKTWAANGRSSEGWEDAVQICAGHAGPAALKKDGTVLVSDPDLLDNYEEEDWTGLVRIALRGNLIGLKADGTLVSCGYDMDGQCHVTFWEDVVDLYTVSDLSVGVRKDGTLITTGGSTWDIEEIDTWTGILVVGS